MSGNVLLLPSGNGSLTCDLVRSVLPWRNTHCFLFPSLRLYVSLAFVLLLFRISFFFFRPDIIYEVDVVLIYFSFFFFFVFVFFFFFSLRLFLFTFCPFSGDQKNDVSGVKFAKFCLVSFLPHEHDNKRKQCFETIMHTLL